METCYDSDNITIVLHIIRSSVGRFNSYVKELPKSKVGIISPIGYKYMFQYK